jgi:hypothetical protein
MTHLTMTQAEREAYLAPRASTFHCVRCDQDVTVEHSGMTTGYGLDKDNRPVCDACCAAWDKANMIASGKGWAYLTKDKAGKWVVSNWPGSMVYPVAVTWSGHSIAGSVRFVRFIGPDDAVWSGKQMGDYNTLCYCKRTKIDPANIRA